MERLQRSPTFNPQKRTRPHQNRNIDNVNAERVKIQNTSRTNYAESNSNPNINSSRPSYRKELQTPVDSHRSNTFFQHNNRGNIDGEYMSTEKMGKTAKRRSSIKNISQQGSSSNLSARGVSSSQFLHRSSQRRIGGTKNNSNGFFPSKSSSSNPNFHQTPMLTVLLVKLEERMIGYCKFLAHPTTSNAVAAAKLLDVSAIRSQPTTPKQKSKRAVNEGHNRDTHSFSPKSLSSLSQGKQPSSPFSSASNSPSTPKQKYKLSMSPKSLRLFSDIAQTLSWSPSNDKGNSTPGQQAFNLALEAEWKKFVSPLLLLAGAEALFSRLEHIILESEERVGENKNRHSNEKNNKDIPPKRNPIVDNCRVCFSGALASILSKPKKGIFEEEENIGASTMAPLRDNSAHSKSYEYHKNIFSNEKDRENSKIKVKKLLTMYRNVTKEVTAVKEILCDPILRINEEHKSRIKPMPQSIQDSSARGTANNQPPQKTTNISQSQKAALNAASSLSSTFNAILLIVSARCKLISIHTDLFFSKSFTKTDSASSLFSESALSDENNHSTTDGDDESEAQPEFLLQISQRCHALLGSLPSCGNNERDDLHQCGAALSMVNALKHEIKALLAALTACQSVNQCRFYETAILVRKLKVHLSPKSPFYCFPPPPLHIWLHIVLSNIISKMSIYFDRTEAFSSHVYNFRTPESFISDNMDVSQNMLKSDRSYMAPTNFRSIDMSKPSASSAETSDDKTINRHNLNPSKRFVSIEDYDKTILDFLRKHDSKGGSILAVAVLLDVKVGSKPYFERGFMCGATSYSKNNRGSDKTNEIETSYSFFSDESVDGIQSWPAIYLRTTQSLRHIKTLKENNQNVGVGSNARNTSSRSLMKMNVPKINFSSGYLSSPKDQLASKTGSSQSQTANHESKLAGEEITTDPSSRENSSMNRTWIDSSQKCSVYWPKSDEINWPLIEWPNVVSLLMEKKSAPINHNVTTQGGMALLNIAREPFTHRETRLKQGPSGRKESCDETVTTDSPKPLSRHNSENTRNSNQGEIPVKDNNTAVNERPRRRQRQPSRSRLFSHIKTSSFDLSSIDLNSNSTSNLTSAGSSQNHGNFTSVYHAVQIDFHSWMVIFSKEEEGRRFRRSPGLSDAEIRTFLDEMSSKLRSDHLFSFETVAKARKDSQQVEISMVKEPSLVPSVSSTNLWSGIGRLDIEKKQFVKSLKKMVGLDTVEGTSWNNFITNLKGSNFSRENIEAIASSRQERMEPREDQIDSGAHAFFLGSTLKNFI